jgi:hypothetical protein
MEPTAAEATATSNAPDESDGHPLLLPSGSPSKPHHGSSFTRNLQADPATSCTFGAIAALTLALASLVVVVFDSPVRRSICLAGHPPCVELPFALRSGVACCLPQQYCRD